MKRRNVWFRNPSHFHSGAYLGSGDSDSFFKTTSLHIFMRYLFNTCFPLPNEYSLIHSKYLFKYLVLNYISNLALLKPLGENGRLRVIQDLTDLELSIEQFILNGGSKVTFSQIGVRLDEQFACAFHK